jgi:periplasmic divalent cation tolerance protein
MNASVLLLFCTCPDAASAELLATGLVEAGLAACVTLLPPSQSIYRWQGKIERSSEIPLLIKSTVESYSELAAWVTANHPYDVPELIAVPVERGLPDYLNWVCAETRRG